MSMLIKKKPVAAEKIHSRTVPIYFLFYLQEEFK